MSAGVSPIVTLTVNPCVVLLDAEGVPRRFLPIAGWTRQNLNVFEETTAHQFRFVLRARSSPEPRSRPASRK